MRFFNRSPDLESGTVRKGTKDNIQEKLAANALTPKNSEDPSAEGSKSMADEEVSAEKLKAFLEEYDPHPVNLPKIFPMSEHRAMIRTMFLDNMLYYTAKLHKHNWILLSKNEKYKARSSLTSSDLSLFH